MNSLIARVSLGFLSLVILAERAHAWEFASPETTTTRYIYETVYYYDQPYYGDEGDSQDLTYRSIPRRTRTQRYSSTPRQSRPSRQSQNRYRQPRSYRGDVCKQILPTVTQIVGQSRAACYLRLFRVESGCRWNLPQRAGNAGNPYAAYGLCSIERSPAIRRLQRRPAACNDISTLSNQVRCCQALMRKTPHYFGPVIRKEVRRCG